MKYIKCILSLTLICAVMAVLLAAVNYITAPVIADNEAKKANEALLVVMPNGEGFASVDISKYTLPQSVTEVFTEKNGGTVVKLTVAGFGPNMNIMVGVDKDGTVTGATCLSSEETLGFEKTYGETLTGATVDTVDGIDTVSGATKTTAAYKGAVKDALNTVLVLSGAEVDLRTEEEKLRDNLAAALPAANGEFEEYFAPIELEGISAVYEAVNGVGFVYIAGENFVAVDNDGKVIGEVDAALKTLVEEQAAKIVAIKNASINLDEYEIPESVVEAYRENGGYVITLLVEGFNPGMVIKCTIDKDGTVTDATCLSSEETLGFEKTYGETLTGATVDTVDGIDTVSGATKTTAAYKGAVKDALNAALVFGGAEVDLRTEEEIFQDNLKAALPAADAFTTVFMLDVIEGIDAVYSANNGAGYVVCIGESFIGVDADGKVISEGVSTEEKAVATGAVATIRSWELTEIDITAYADMPTAIVAANKTNGGNYVLDVKAAGYGINGGSKYHPASGEYIYIKVSVTPDGTIVDCVTVSQAESTGIGDVCATPEYYTQYNGKTAETYSEVDTVADATITTKGYMQAIGRVFEALTILNGGAN